METSEAAAAASSAVLEDSVTSTTGLLMGLVRLRPAAGSICFPHLTQPEYPAGRLGLLEGWKQPTEQQLASGHSRW